MNLKYIEGAKNVWVIERHKTTNDVPTLDDLAGESGYIKKMPSAPWVASILWDALTRNLRAQFPAILSDKPWGASVDTASGGITFTR